MTWATPKTYAWLYRVSLTEEYRRQLLAFLPADLRKLVQAELKKGDIPKAVPHTPALGPRNEG